VVKVIHHHSIDGIPECVLDAFALKGQPNPAGQEHRFAFSRARRRVLNQRIPFQSFICSFLRFVSIGAAFIGSFQGLIGSLLSLVDLGGELSGPCRCRIGRALGVGCLKGDSIHCRL
jgi:hypothetical protein